MNFKEEIIKTTELNAYKEKEKLHYQSSKDLEDLKNSIMNKALEGKNSTIVLTKLTENYCKAFLLENKFNVSLYGNSNLVKISWE